MDIIVKLLKNIPIDEIQDLNNSKKKYWLYLNKKPIDIEVGDRAYIYYKQAIAGYLFYQGFEEKESREGDFTKSAFKLSGPYHEFLKSLKIDLPGSWLWRYIDRVPGLEKLIESSINER